MLDTIMVVDEGDVFDLMKDLAYQGAQDGATLLCRDDECCRLSIFKKLHDVPMGYIEGAAFIATLAAAHGMEKSYEEIHIEWPFTIKRAGQKVCTLSTSAGFQGGLFSVVNLEFTSDISEDALDMVVTQVVEELEKWREDVVNKKILAGPVSQCLSEYFDYIPELGKDTLVQTPEGKLIHVGYFGGLDVWGHAIIVDDQEKEKSFAPGEVILIPTEE